MTILRTLVVCGLVFGVGCSPKADPASSARDRDASATPAAGSVSSMSPNADLGVKVARVQRQPLISNVEFTGSLLPRRRTQIFAEVEGVIKNIPQVGPKFDVVVDGQHYVEQLGLGLGHQVKQGDVLLELDPTDLENEVLIQSAKLAKAQADLAKLKAWDRDEEIRRLAALVDEAKARHEQTKRDQQRIARLHQRRATTASEVEKAELEVATSKAVFDAAQAKLQTAKAGPTQAELAVQEALVAEAQAEWKKAKADVKKATIVAPYDGVITAINVEVGQRVAPGGDPLVEIMDLRFVVAELGIAEKYIGQIHIKDTAKVYAAGTTQPVPAMVININDLVDPTTRCFATRLAIDNAKRLFKAGQFVRVLVPMGSDTQEKLVVPNQALTYVQGQPHVFVVRDHKAHLTPISIGASNLQFTEVTQGLRVGDHVVTDDPALLTQGTPVRVLNNQK